MILPSLWVVFLFLGSHRVQSQSCPGWFYGENCTKSCLNCLQSCNSADGCRAGFQGPYCNQNCPNFHYGKDCKYNCNTCSSNCDPVTGRCDKCKPGYAGSACDVPCPGMTYGENCSRSCSNCLQSCNSINGICKSGGCRAGFQGPFCNQTCEQGKFGETCSQKCGKCKNPQFCSRTTGECPGGCQPGFSAHDKRCLTECHNGTYGNNCTVCGHCNNGVPCNTTSGVCRLGCQDGYNFTADDKCFEPCDSGSFGANCSETCGNCKNGSICNHISGTCPLGCEWEYSPSDSRCYTIDPFGTQFKVAVVASGILGGLVVVMIVVLCYLRRKRKCVTDLQQQTKLWEISHQLATSSVSSNGRCDENRYFDFDAAAAATAVQTDNQNDTIFLEKHMEQDPIYENAKQIHRESTQDDYEHPCLPKKCTNMKEADIYVNEI